LRPIGAGEQADAIVDHFVLESEAGRANNDAHKVAW
jgi:hypothetical protein